MMGLGANPIIGGIGDVIVGDCGFRGSLDPVISAVPDDVVFN